MKEGYWLSFSKFSPEDRRAAFYELTRGVTWGAHRPKLLNSTTSQTISVDFTTELGCKEETYRAGLKLSPSYVSATRIGYHVKSPTMEPAGRGKRVPIDSMLEDSMPLYLPNSVLGCRMLVEA
jgi:hypothetical protein